MQRVFSKKSQAANLEIIIKKASVFMTFFRYKTILVSH